MKIEDIYRNKEISVRSYNVCKYNNLHLISDVIKYYKQNKSFNNLPKCGRKSDSELTEICLKYQDENFIEVESSDGLVLDLSRTQREVVNSFIFTNLNNLSVRSRNAILLYLNNNIKIKNFAEKILLSKSYSVKSMQNVGAKCVPEIEYFISIIKDFILEVSQTNDEKYLIGLKNKYLIQRTFNILKIPESILERESIFRLTNFLLDQEAFFDEKQTFIIKNSLKIYTNHSGLSRTKIAVGIGLTKERVRQLEKLCFNSLFNKLLFIASFNDDLFQNYSIDVDSNYINVDTDILEIINNLNYTYFSEEFATYILSAYLVNSFTLFGNLEDVLLFKDFNAINRHKWRKFHLVKKEIASEIDIDSLINDISRRLSDKIEESYSFNFKSYLFKFLTNNNISILESIFPVCEKIINDEFELYLDLDENLIFKRNKARQAHEYAFEALEQIGKPSKVAKIFEIVKQLYPNYNTDEDKIRVSMKRINGFVPVGRRSIFGLKKWEKELDNFRGGTIRSISEEYLNQFSNPKHINDITDYVLKFRPNSNSYSIIQNLKLEEHGMFVFYKDSYVGLKSKNYDSNSRTILKDNNIEKKTWAESFELLQDFVKSKNRLPFSSGVTEEEEKLYRWVNIQKKRENSGYIDEIEFKKLKSLINKFENISGKRPLSILKKYDELLLFVSLNNRLPSARKENEHNLYQFFYKQRKLFDDNKLNIKEEIKFIEVAKLLQNK
ncbi:helicase associated domain-containing protein [Maribacter sp. HS]|uniref:helicase associated domain-containing protein n=1 Tax=Maribacter sp. HS TaxID=3110480 RepID=UPI003A8B0E97